MIIKDTESVDIPTSTGPCARTSFGPWLRGGIRRNKGVRNHSQSEIVDDLEAALEQFRLIANDLGSDASEKVT